MKKFLLAVCVAAGSWANAQAYEGTVDYQKKSEPALVIEYNYPQDVVEAALKEKMSGLGYKARSNKGFIVYQGAVISDISSSPMDYAFKVDRKSRKEKDVSLVYMVMGGANALSADNSAARSNGRYFLGNLAPYIQSGSLEKEIKDQEETVVRSEKKFKTLQDDKADKEKKIKKLQEEIRSNEKDQESQLRELEKQRGVLDALKGKRRS